ncbi:MAG TPA: kelch repeat-containing protein [Myxococcales bacterium]|nr:kelch repeat-containing protein [Myxococcales bacterium]
MKRILLLAALLSACGPDLSNLPCASSTECATGYVCNLSTGKCEPGESKPEITLLTDVGGITFNHSLLVRALVVDPEGIDTVTVQLGTSPAVNAVETAAGSSIFSATIDTTSAFDGQDTTVNAVVTAKNKKGATNTATLNGVHIDNKGPTLGGLTVTPSGTIFPGQVVAIGVDVGESLGDAPIVTLLPPSGPSRTAALVTQGAATHFDYQFATLHSDPAGTWTVSVSAHDAFQNVSSTTGSGFTLHADVSGGVGVTASATALKLGASTTITATFTQAIVGLPTVSLAGSAQTATKTSGAAGDSVFTYSLSAPAAPGTEEGTHVLTVSGTTVSGATVSGTITLDFDFTAPSFSLFVSGNYPNGPNALPAVNRSMPGSIQWVAPGSEPFGAGASVTATLNGSTAVPPDGTFAQTPSFSVPFSSLPDGISTLSVRICDAANNCTTHTASVDEQSFESPVATVGPSGPFKVGDSVGATVQLTQPALDPSALTLVMSNGATSFPLSLTACGGCGANTYAFSGAVPATAGNGNYSALASGSDVYGNSFNNVASSSSVTLKTSLPVLSVVSNPGWAARSATVNFVVGFTSGDDFSTGSTAGCLDPTQADPGDCSTGTVIGPPALSASQAQFTYSAPATPTTAQHYLRVIYTDVAGNSDKRSLPFIYDGVFPALNAVAPSRPTVLAPGEAVSVVYSLNKSTIASTTSTSAITNVTHPPPVAIGAGQYSVTYTMPAACNGTAGNPTSGVAFNVGLTATDAAGNPQQSFNIQLICNNAPTVAANPAWDPTAGIAGSNGQAGTPGSTLKLTVTVNELVGSFAANSALVTVGAATLLDPGLTGTMPAVYSVPIALNSPCNGTTGPADFTPLALTIAAKDSAGHLSVAVPAGSVTCNIQKSPAPAAPVNNYFRLVQAPYADGSVRTYVSAAPTPPSFTSAPVNPAGTPASRVGLFLYACASAPCSASNSLGSGPVNTADGTVYPFQVAAAGNPAPTQVILQLLDSAGSTPVTVSGYTNEVDLGYQGRLISGSANPATAYDATGTDATIPPDAWIADGGAGPLPQLAPCNTMPPPPLPADAGYTAPSYCALADDDYNYTAVTSAGAALPSQPLGWHPANPLAASPPGARYAAGFAPQFVGNSNLIVYGGLSSGGSLNNDPPGALWQFGYSSGNFFMPTWTLLTIASGTNPPQMWGTLMGTDGSGDFFLFGGWTNGGGTIYNGNIFKATAIGGSQYTWAPVGSTGAPADVMPATMALGGIASTSNYFVPNPQGASISASYALMVGGIGTLSGANCRLYLYNTNPPGTTTTRFIACDVANLAGRIGPAVAFGGPSGSEAFYSFGGLSGSTLTNDLLRYTVTNVGAATWTLMNGGGSGPQFPPARQGAVSWVDLNTGHVFIFGGSASAGGAGSTNSPLNDTWEYNPSTNTWQQLVNPLGSYVPAARAYAAVSGFNLCDSTGTGSICRTEVSLFGGGANTSVSFNDSWYTGRENVNRLLMKLPLSTVSNVASAVGSGNMVAQLRAQNVLQGTRPYVWDGGGWRNLPVLFSGPVGGNNGATTIDISQSLSPLSGAGALIQNNSIYLMFDAQGTNIAPPNPPSPQIVPATDSVGITLTWH